LRKNIKKVIWFTGLSGSGKSTLSKRLVNYLKGKKYSCIILDGDEIRAGLCSDLKFDEQDRVENIRRIAEISSLMIKQNDFVVVATISPNNKLRDCAKKIIGKELFKLVYLSTSFESCKARDPKGLYKKAFSGKIKNFTGMTSVFQPPVKYDLEIDTSHMTIKQSFDELIKLMNI
jgi:adenylyl-sulfate kinase